MKLTAQILLRPNREQKEVLISTLEIANSCCQKISDYAFENKVFNKYELQKRLYYQLKEDFKLTAEIVIRCINKVAVAYKTNKTTKAKFKKHGAIPYDNRILRFKTKNKCVSIWTLNGREIISYKVGIRQEKMLNHQKGESDLIYNNNNLFLLSVCEIEEGMVQTFKDVIGVDFGIINIAVTSDNEIYSGEKTEEVRRWYSNRRAKLQGVGTKSAKRRLKNLSGKEKRFKRNTNHIISKIIVKIAKDTNRAIAIENLHKIATKTTVRQNKAMIGNWAFKQLRAFITYKAMLCGTTIILVNPKYTSQRCNKCGYTDKANRKSQSEFICKKCNHNTNADLNAALNIQLLGRSQSAYGGDLFFYKSVASL